jgi:alpha-glucosidase
VNVENKLKQNDSILNFYKSLLRVRKNSEALQVGRWRTLIYYPYEHLAYLRETKQERVLILINFSYEKDLGLDESIERPMWDVLLSTKREVGKMIDLPEKLQPFEVSILRKL